MGFIRWGCLCALFLCTPMFALTPENLEDLPTAIHFGAKSSEDGRNVSLTIAEATTDEEARNLDALVLREAREAVDAGEALVTMIVTNDGSLPAALQTVGEQIADMGTVVLVSDGSEFGIKQALQRQRFHRRNRVYTVARVLGVGAAMTKVIAITYDVPLSVAAPVGFGAALYSGLNQLVAKPRQRWLLSKKFFGFDDYVSEGEPNSVPMFYNKLMVSTTLFLAIIRGLCYARGLESLEEVLALGKLGGFVFNILSSTTLEFCWQRFIALSVHKKDTANPGNHYQHLDQAARLMVLLSIIGSAVQGLAAEGWTVGYVGISVIAASGAVLLVRSFPNPEGLVARVQRDLAQRLNCFVSLFTK